MGAAHTEESRDLEPGLEQQPSFPAPKAFWGAQGAGSSQSSQMIPTCPQGALVCGTSVPYKYSNFFCAL